MGNVVVEVATQGDDAAMSRYLKEPATEFAVLEATLAQRVMGWVVGPDRYVLRGSSWMPRWRFQPTRSIDDAFRLLDHARPESYSMGSNGRGVFSVKIQISGKSGAARDNRKALAITLAVARALGLERR